MGKPSKKNFYAIHKGHQTGVFQSWSDAEPLVKGFAGAKFKGFGTKPEAEYFAKHGREMPAGDRSAAAATKDVFQVKKSGPMKAAGSSSSSSGKMNHVPMHVAAAAMASASAAASSQPPHLSPTLIPRNRFDPNTLVVSASPKLPRDADIISHFADATLLPPRPEAQKRAFDQAIEVDGVRRGALDGERQIPFHEYGSQPGWLKVYTDGSCFGNGKGVTVAKAGIGAFFGYGDPRNISEPLSLHTPMDLPSNQKAEIQAVTESLKRVPPDQDVMILTDSQYVIKAMTEWIKNWRRKQFDGVANKEYFFALEDELRKRSAKIQWEYVPGHSGMEGNEKADQLAKAGAERYVRVSAGKGKVKA